MVFESKADQGITCRVFEENDCSLIEAAGVAHHGHHAMITMLSLIYDMVMV